MTDDEIIDAWTTITRLVPERANIIAFARALLAREREANARVCDDIEEKHLQSGRYASVIADHSVRAGGQVDGAKECAAAIRSRT